MKFRQWTIRMREATCLSVSVETAQGVPESEVLFKYAVLEP